jgi:hypothetical protein
MRKFNQNIYWCSFYGSLLVLSIMLGGSIEQKEAVNKLANEKPKKVDSIELAVNRILILEGANCNTIGDSGKSYGCFQITKDCVKDVNRRFGTTYRHKDMFDSAKGRKVAYLYLKLGSELYEKKHSKSPTQTELLRMYNGGIYNGHRNKKTLKYCK